MSMPRVLTMRALLSISTCTVECVSMFESEIATATKPPASAWLCA